MMSLTCIRGFRELYGSWNTAWTARFRMFTSNPFDDETISFTGRLWVKNLGEEGLALYWEREKSGSEKERFRALNVLEVLDWDDQARQDAFQGSSMKRAKLSMIRRNAVIVAGNILARKSDPDLLKKLQEIQMNEDEDPLVRSTAQAVLHAHR